MKKLILFQGDSITDARRDRESETGWGFDMGSGYAILIAGRLQKDHLDDGLICENRGISGNRVVDLYARWKIDALNLKPDLLSILIGVNDTWHEIGNHNGVEVPRYAQFLRMLMQWTQAELPQTKIVLMEPFVLVTGSVEESWLAEMDARRQVVKEVAAEFGTIFLPLQDMFNDAAKLAPANYWLNDGVHPTAAGHKLISDAWLKATSSIR